MQGRSAWETVGSVVRVALFVGAPLLFVACAHSEPDYYVYPTPPEANRATPLASPVQPPSGASTMDAPALQRQQWRTSETANAEYWSAALNGYQPAASRSVSVPFTHAQRVAWANYINALHWRLHERFALSYLVSLGDRWMGEVTPGSEHLSVRIELIIDGETGTIRRLGVIQSSGIVDFDIGALESFKRARVFPSPPEDIVSADGSVYLHWDLHRDPVFACSSYFARPYLLRHHAAAGG